MEHERRIAELERELAYAREEAARGRFFRKLIESMHEIVTVLGADGRVIYISPAGERTTGISTSKLEGMRAPDVLHPDDRPRTLERMKDAFASRPDEELRIELRRSHADGHWLHMETSSSNRTSDPDIGGLVLVGREITATVQMREALLEAQTRYRALFEDTSVAVTVRDVDTQAFIDCNTAALSLYGYSTREELRASIPTDLAPATQPEGRSSGEMLKEHVARALRDGVAQMTWMARRRTGELFPAEVHTTLINVGAGRRILQTMIEDVTERRRDEAALRDRARRDDLVSRVSRQFVQGSNEHAVPFALEAIGSFLRASRVRLRRFSPDGNTLTTIEQWGAPGVPPFPYPSQDGADPFVRWVNEQVAVRGFLSVADVDRMPAEVLAMAVERPVPEIRAILVLPISNETGLTGWIVVDDVVGPRPWSDDDVYTARLVGELVAVGRARADAEAQLRRQAARDEILRDVSRRFLNDDPDAAIDATLHRLGTTLDLERASLFALDETTNRLRCTHRWGLPGDGPSFESLEAYPGPPSESGEPGDAGQGAADRWRDAIQRESGERVRLAPVGYGGRFFGLLTVRARDGSVVGEHDALTLDLVGELIAIGRVRSAAEIALARAKEDAVAASRTKSAFLANMSHELRTPLNGVIGMVDLLAATPLDARQRRYTEIARASASLLLSVINDVLDFSKIEAGKLDVASIPFALEDVLGDVASILSHHAEEKGLRLTFESGAELEGLLVGDPSRIRQVLVNLVANAIRFTPAGGVAVRTSLRGDVAPEARISVRFEVEDTGVGIAPEAQKRLFQPFTQLDASPTREHGGTGLGLAICRELVQRMSGSIGVSSIEGTGSTFWFELAFARATPSEDASGSDPRIAARRALPDAAPHRDVLRGNLLQIAGRGASFGSHADSERPAGARVLLVEDSPINAEVASEILRTAGYAVDLAVDGAAAIEAVSAHAYDIVLMDCQLPGVDGYEASRRIRATGRTLPIVALTASVTKEDLDRCFASGMSDHVSKPVDARRLLTVIAEHLEAEGAPPAPKHPSSAPVLDLSRALERLRGDTALLRKIAVQFARVAPEARTTLREAVERKDARALGFAAHRLRGQAASFEGTALVAATAALEDAGRRENWTAAGAALLVVETEIDRLLRALVAQQP